MSSLRFSLFTLAATPAVVCSGRTSRIIKQAEQGCANLGLQSHEDLRLQLEPSSCDWMLQPEEHCHQSKQMQGFFLWVVPLHSFAIQNEAKRVLYPCVCSLSCFKVELCHTLHVFGFERCCRSRFVCFGIPEELSGSQFIFYQVLESRVCGHQQTHWSKSGSFQSLG